MDILRPTTHLQIVTGTFPQLGQHVDRMRSERGGTLPQWPDWCFLPIAGAAAIVTGGRPAANPRLAQTFGIVAALATWRVTQGVYQVDPDTFEALWQTPLTGELPCQLLKHLPEWCVYVQCPQPRRLVGAPETIAVLYGWYAHLEWDVKTHQEELRLLLDLGQDGESPPGGLLPFPVHLGPWSLEEGIKESLRASIPQLQRVGMTDPAFLEAFANGERQMAAVLAPLVSITLYLCSLAADVTSHTGTRVRPTTPAPTKTKKGLRLFPPDQPHVWDVGFVVGSELRARPAWRAPEKETDEDTTGRKRPRPHARMAHWHVFWTGKGRTIPRVRWVYAIRVAGYQGDLVPTLHPVATVEGHTA
jgi:hypothetical protein